MPPADSAPRLAHIRQAFDPLAGPPPHGPAEEEARSGRIYVCGATAHAAAGLQPPAHHHRHASALATAAHPPLRTPHLLTTLLDQQVVQASCGWRHSALVLDSGDVYMSGDNSHGQLGLGLSAEAEEAMRAGRPFEPPHAPAPAKLPLLGRFRVSQVSCGKLHSAFVCHDGELFAMGLNIYGQLGLGSLEDVYAPRQVERIGGAAASVSCGDFHTLVLRHDGRALSCGLNDSGRLGRPVDGATAAGGAAEAEGAAGESGDAAAAAAAAPCSDTFGALPLHAAVASQSDAFAVVAVAAGGAHTAVVCADGSVYTCGRGECGQLGHGAEPADLVALQPRRIAALKQHRIRRAALGQVHSLFLTSLGTPFACGSGGYGRLGLGARANCYAPQMVESLGGEAVVQISAGERHSSFVTEGGAVFLCGDDGDGALGLDGPRKTSLVPRQPSKFDKPGTRVLGASCGGAHTAFLLRAVVDIKEDYRSDQLEIAAATIEAFFRGNHVRVYSEAVQKRKRNGRADHMHTLAQRDAAACVIQSAARMHLAENLRHRKAQIRRMRELRGDEGGDDPDAWGKIQRQFTAAVAGRALTAEAERAAYLTKASW